MDSLEEVSRILNAYASPNPHPATPAACAGIEGVHSHVDDLYE
jgi:hypothetical protein